MSYTHKTIPVLSLQALAVTDYREALLRTLCEKLGLEEILEYIERPEFETNNPYHNPAHCKRVALRLAELLMASNELDLMYQIEFDLQQGIVAALFHDFRHTGHGPDSRNIEIAVNGLLEAECVKDYFGEGNETIAIIADAIRCTEFKQGFPVEPYTRVQCALRDADVMESCEPNGVKYVLFDLAEEMGVEVADAIHMQIGFLQQVQMYTEAGKAIWAATLDSRIMAVGALGLQEDPPRYIGKDGGLGHGV